MSSNSIWRLPCIIFTQTHYSHNAQFLWQSGYRTGNNEQPELTRTLLGLKLVSSDLKSQQWRTTESQTEQKKLRRWCLASSVTNRSFNKRFHIDKIWTCLFFEEWCLYHWTSNIPSHCFLKHTGICQPMCPDLQLENMVTTLIESLNYAWQLLH